MKCATQGKKAVGQVERSRTQKLEAFARAIIAPSSVAPRPVKCCELQPMSGRSVFKAHEQALVA
jgi:hypothetical protein